MTLGQTLAIGSIALQLLVWTDLGARQSMLGRALRPLQGMSRTTKILVSVLHVAAVFQTLPSETNLIESYRAWEESRTPGLERKPDWSDVYTGDMTSTPGTRGSSHDGRLWQVVR